MEKKKVAIVGYTSTSELAPYNDEEFEIWGLNDLYDYIPRYDRWFDLHPRSRLDSKVSSRSQHNHIEMLKSMTCPVYMQQHHEDIPYSVAYPLDEIIEHFSKYFSEKAHAKYFSNSVSYMVALAIAEGFEEIHIYGVDMATDSEYDFQRPSCEFWIGVAIGAGIKIHIPLQSDLLKTRFLYGFEEEQKRAFDLKLEQYRKDIDKRKREWEQQLENSKAMVNQFIGAEKARQEIKRAWS